MKEILDDERKQQERKEKEPVDGDKGGGDEGEGDRERDEEVDGGHRVDIVDAHWIDTVNDAH